MRAARMLFALTRGEIVPTVGWQKIPMVTPAERYATAEWPMKEWFDLAREMERRPGVISVSPFPVQPWLDVRELGWTALVYTNNDVRLAQELAAELANKAWELRDEFWVVDRVPLSEAVRQAVEAEEGPIMICDASDCVPCGAPGDSTWVLKEMLTQRIDCTAILPMVDPEVVEQAMEAGAGSEITALVGGKQDNVFSEPVTVSAYVAAVSEARTVAVTRYGSYDMGAAVLLEIGSIKLVVSEHRGVGEVPLAVYSEFGLDPAEIKMVVVRTVGRYVARYLGALVKEAFIVDCPGLAGWDLNQFSWVRKPHPIYPLDELSEWQAKV
jgi:microcystin degradation protein MlrC